GAVGQVLQVPITAVELLHLRGQLGIDGVQFFVDRLHFLAGGFQLLVCRLQLLVPDWSSSLELRSSSSAVACCSAMDCSRSRKSRFSRSMRASPAFASG